MIAAQNPVEALFNGNGLLGKVHDQLFLYVKKRFGNSLDLDEVVQTALVNAWKRQDTFRSDSRKGEEHALLDWLRGIVRNEAVDEYRRQRRKDEVLESQLGEDGQALLAHYLGAEDFDGMESAENVTRIHGHVARLNDRDRAFITLSMGGNCSYLQIAEIMDVPKGTVKSALHCARARLEKMLGEDELYP